MNWKKISCILIGAVLVLCLIGISIWIGTTDEDVLSSLPNAKDINLQRKRYISTVRGNFSPIYANAPSFFHKNCKALVVISDKRMIKNDPLL